MKKIITASIAVLLAVFMFTACGKSKGKVLVEINGDDITEGDLQLIGDANPRIKAQLSSPMGQKQILDNLVEQELFYQEAIKRGLNRDAGVKARIDFYRKIIIAQALLDNEAELEAKKYYDSKPEEFKKIKLSDIVINFGTPEADKAAPKGKEPKAKGRTEEEALKLANEIKAKLDAGEDFSKLASEFSEDPATKARGGDMGLVAKGDPRVERMGLTPVIDKAYEIKVGEIAGPIKTQKGYYIITVTKGAEVEPFESAKSTIMAKSRGEIRTQLLEKFKKESKIVYPEEEKKKAEMKAKADADKKADDVKKPEGEATPEAAKPAAEAPAAPEAKDAKAPEAATPATNDQAAPAAKTPEAAPAVEQKK